MFNTNSDYAINKHDPDAIVCRSTTGQLLRITRENFASDEEFEKWKTWSDADYHNAERQNRAYDDRRRPLSDDVWRTADRDDWIERILGDAEEDERAEFIERVRNSLTDMQFSRLGQRYAEGRELADIAAAEGVSITAVASSIERAERRLKRLRRLGLL